MTIKIFMSNVFENVNSKIPTPLRKHTPQRLRSEIFKKNKNHDGTTDSSLSPLSFNEGGFPELGFFQKSSAK